MVTTDDLADAVPLAEAADQLGISAVTLRRMIKRRDIEVLRIGTGRGRIYLTQRAITDYINRRQQRTA